MFAYGGAYELSWQFQCRRIRSAFYPGLRWNRCLEPNLRYAWGPHSGFKNILFRQEARRANERYNGRIARYEATSLTSTAGTNAAVVS